MERAAMSAWSLARGLVQRLRHAAPRRQRARVEEFHPLFDAIGAATFTEEEVRAYFMQEASAEDEEEALFAEGMSDEAQLDPYHHPFAVYNSWEELESDRTGSTETEYEARARVEEFRPLFDAIGAATFDEEEVRAYFMQEASAEDEEEARVEEFHLPFDAIGADTFDVEEERVSFMQEASAEVEEEAFVAEGMADEGQLDPDEHPFTFYNDSEELKWDRAGSTATEDEAWADHVKKELFYKTFTESEEREMWQCRAQKSRSAN